MNERWGPLLVFAVLALAVTVLFGLLGGLNPWVVTALGWLGGLAVAGAAVWYDRKRRGLSGWR